MKRNAIVGLTVLVALALASLSVSLPTIFLWLAIHLFHSFYLLASIDNHLLKPLDLWEIAIKGLPMKDAHHINGLSIISKSDPVVTDPDSVPSRIIGHRFDIAEFTQSFCSR